MSEKRDEGVFWCGRPIEDLTREELIAAVKLLGSQYQTMLQERIEMNKHVNWRSYILRDKVSA